MKSFTATPYIVNGWTVVRLPPAVSAELPSRSMVMGEVEVDGNNFTVPLEPDGRGGHWFRLQADVAGREVEVTLQPAKTWPRPTPPADLEAELAKTPAAAALWPAITPKAQWEWIRWIRATNRDETRQRRVEVACSKLSKGMRRPCCFNAAACTEPTVSRNYLLIEKEGL